MLHLLVFPILLFLMFFYNPTGFAESEDTSSKLIEYLAQEKLNLTLALSNAKAFIPPANQAEYIKLLRENEDMIALNRAKIASFESFLINQNKRQMDFNLRIKQLQQFTLSRTPQVNLQEKIEKVTTLNDLNKKTIELINDNLALATRFQDLLVAENKKLGLWKSKSQMTDQLILLHEQEDKLNISLQKLFENSLKLQQQRSALKDFKPIYDLESRILLNNQIINLTQHKMSELNLQRKLARADYSLLQNPDIRTLEKVAEIYKSSISQLSDIEQSLKKMVLMLKYEQPHITDAQLKQRFTALVRVISQRIEGITIQEQTLQEDLENHQLELKKQLSVRKNLSEYRLDSWPAIIHQFSLIPSQFYNYLKSLTLKIRDNYLWQDGLPAIILWAMLALTGVAFFYLNKLMKHATQNKERSRLSAHLYDGALYLFSRNLPYLAVTGFLFVLFYFNQIPYANYQLLFNLFLVWLTFRTIILIARIGLMERISDSSGTDVRLYYRIRWLLLIGGWTTALMVFSYELPMTLLLQDIFNRLFMLFLVAVSIVIWKSREVITILLHPLLKSKKTYLRNAIMLLVILTPLTLFGIAITGLIGYINLAWTMSRYQVQILSIITAYVLIRGLLFDALELVSEWMIRKLKNGWLWIEIFLKPFDKILRILLIIASIIVLSGLFDWPLLPLLQQFGDYSLVNISGIHITGVSIVEFLMLVSVFIWISKWTREFCFRRLYRNTSDAGIRNSLSVFTQYAVILIGSLITLHTLGLDFSGMSMVIGGLAVGMGFGLRDFASNIVGGLMLLIERPVREGDLITLGGYEGRVAHIGIRSMRVSSWDNMEVLIPNAETFNKPFTNWTHQDSIVRTVIPVKVSRVDDPVMIQQLILDVLAIIPEILAEPAPQVLLENIDQALIGFEVRYFINVQLYTRFEIRSKVLFAITAQFKACGIHSPIPPIIVEMSEDKHASDFTQLFPKK